MQNFAAALENSVAVPLKLNMELPYGPAIPPIGRYPRELKTCACTKACTQMFIRVLFIITKNCEQPKCPSTDEQITNVVY